MPYVRSHGNQVVIVHGERDTSTGNVIQRKLFTFYSKVEAAAAIGGENNRQDSQYFRQLLQDANPHIQFNWKSLEKALKEKMDELPDLYPIRHARSEDGFQKALDEFVRQLLLTDPQNSLSGQTTLKAHADDLSVLQKLIGDRLERRYWRKPEVDEDDFMLDSRDPFCWRHEIKGAEVPGDIEEIASEFYDSGNYKEARKWFRLLTRCFPSYAEGYNWLGLMDLKENELARAIEHFNNTIKYGRTLFPKRVAKSSYWSDHSTRPYMRGLENLGFALLQSGRFKECLDVCQKLERECGDAGVITATAHRATAFLNLQYWELALKAALELIAVNPAEGFIAAYSSYELRRESDAVEFFLHAALNQPHTACILLELKEPKSLSGLEVEDHNLGINLCRVLPRFFKMQSKESRKFFKRFGQNEIVRQLIDEAIERTRNHSSLRGEAHRRNFQRWHELQSREFAAEQTPRIEARLRESNRKIRH